MTIRLVIADDQAVVRDGLVDILSAVDDIVIVGVAEDGAGAVALAEGHEVDVILMDLRMPGTGGVEAARALGTSRPETAVVILTTYDDDQAIAPALEAGARGFLTKDASIHDIRRAVRRAADDRRPGPGPGPGPSTRPPTG